MSTTLGDLIAKSLDEEQQEIRDRVEAYQEQVRRPLAKRPILNDVQEVMALRQQIKGLQYDLEDSLDSLRNRVINDPALHHCLKLDVNRLIKTVS